MEARDSIKFARFPRSTSYKMIGAENGNAGTDGEMHQTSAKCPAVLKREQTIPTEPNLEGQERGKHAIGVKKEDNNPIPTDKLEVFPIYHFLTSS